MNGQLKWRILLVAGLVFSAKLSAQTFADLKAAGSGTVETNCVSSLSSGCTITGTGQVTGTPILASGIILRVDTGGPSSLNGNVRGSQGICVPASGAGSISETGGDTLEFNAVGTICEEGGPSSPYLYGGSYRITGGTGRFASAVGTGNVSAAYTREVFITGGSGAALFHLSGSISY